MTPDASPSPGKILIVDDEVNIRNGLRAVLAKNGHVIRDVGSTEEALALLESFACEAAIVDIRMPGMSGLELLQMIRARWPFISVILLTGHGTMESAMTAVKAGAHDYLLKPAQPDAIRRTIAEALTVSRRRREQTRLVDALRTGLRRLDGFPAPASSPMTISQRQINVGDLSINCQTREVYRGRDSLSLTPSEFKLLVALASRPREVVDYVTLVRLSLEHEAEPWQAKELIKRHIFSLRQKLEPDPGRPCYILNARGIGYRLVSPSQ